MKWVRLSLATVFGGCCGLFSYGAISILVGGVPELTSTPERMFFTGVNTPFAIGLGMTSYGLFRRRRWVWYPYGLFLLYYLATIAFMVLSDTSLASFRLNIASDVMFLVLGVVCPVVALIPILHMRRAWLMRAKEDHLETKGM